jgi:hypothetical protein
MLRCIADCLQRLDTLLADYFHVIITNLKPAETWEVIREMLDEAKSKTNQQDDLGDLGNYCEALYSYWRNEQQSQEPMFRITRYMKSTLPYLQDALEVGYWNMLSELFLDAYKNNARLVSHWRGIVKWMLAQSNLEMKTYLKHLEEMCDPDQLPSAIVRGIELRIKLLDEVLSSITDGVSPENYVLVSQAINKSQKRAMSTAFTTEKSSHQSTSILTLFFATSTIAIIPLAIGFNKSFSVKPRTGATSDANFWWLIVGTILSLQANLITCVKMFQDGLSYAGLVAWGFLGLSTIIGITSVVIYCLANTAWSSTLSYFGAYFALAAMIVTMIGGNNDVGNTTAPGQRDEIRSGEKLKAS